jgi:hypothetical protein
LGSLSLSQPNTIDALVAAAHRRRNLVLLADELPVALSVIFATALLVLLFGTQFLSPVWLLAAFGVGACLAVARVWRKRVNSYKIAQLVDHNLALSDSVSTAWFVLHGSDRYNQTAREYQLAYAGLMLPTIDPARAFPFSRSRHWLVPLVLAVVATGIFGFRYLRANSLDLRPPLVRLTWTEAASRDAQVAREEQAKIPARRAPDGSPVVAPTDGQKPFPVLPKQADASPKNPISEAGTQNASAGGRDQQHSAENEKAPLGQSARQQTEGNTSGDAERRADNENSPRQDTSEQNGPVAPNAQQDDSTQGLVGKMKEALSSLFSKTQPNSTPSDPRSKGAGKSPGRKGAAEGSPKDDSAGKPSTEQAKGSASSAAAGEPTDAKEQSQSSPGGNSDQLGSNKSNDQQSGAGRQDGDKSLRQAEELKAIGKLQEIEGKRSKDMTGEISVEMPSGKQHLSTDYSNDTAQHRDWGIELHRDQVPDQYKQYVKEYMERVRQQPAPQK